MAKKSPKIKATYPAVQRFLDRHVIQQMVECGGPFGPLETCWHIKRFKNEWITYDMARGILRSLTDRGYCYYQRGLFTEDGYTAGAGYGLTLKGLTYYQNLCPTPKGNPQ